MNFQLVGKFGTVGNGNGQFEAPVGIKISHTNSCILVCDCDNSRIQLFDLDSRDFLGCVKLSENLQGLTIEKEGCDMLSDALIFTCFDHCVYKVNLKVLIDSSFNLKQSTMWISSTPSQSGKDLDHFHYPLGVCVKYGLTRSDNTIIV